ncbi:GGDEF domain-containing protein [Butyrivibrio sp. YAB3001]|uniref:GGDEF domain-containing protein n=1 Tax=Butyrivibrio sp. YAB3001 TaxID=1520812 RepID=UPI0008F623EE|nr:GGDEF domain-containing protein [Butyrivibrio sp. YAB3001]SFC20022.1 diguanylate cyclase (GGDEF) domain-containing protein [Butyrivibrio sp. YAB3001]
MNIKHKLRTLFLSLGSIFFIGIIIAFLGSDLYKSPLHYNLVQLDDGWTITHVGYTYTPASLPETNIGIANKGDVITLSRTLDDYDLDPATIHFRSILSTVDIYLDDSLIYTFGHDYVEKGSMLPKFQHFVNLPLDYPGKEIRIVITATENNAFSGLSPVIVGNKEDISRSKAQNGRLSIVIGVFLDMFGFMLLVLSPFLLFASAHDSSIVYSGLISILMGTYILCFNDLFFLFSDIPSFYTFLEYFCLYMIPGGILLFLAAAKQVLGKKVTIAIGVINFIFAFATAILHVTNVVHICHFVTALHIISITEGIYVVVSLIVSTLHRRKHPDDFYTKSMSTNVLLVGLLLLLVFSIIDIVKFNVLKFFEAGEVNTNINFMTIGAFLFIICLVLNYFFHCIEYISATNTKHQLEGLAYNDSLTGLYNRSKCELTLAELTGNYTIISIDLDYLKYTNDNYGHSEGDKLIHGFGMILKNSFTDASLIGRMGGDEFIVILPYIDNGRTEKDLVTMSDLMTYRNTLESRIKYSASYGYASSDDELLKDISSAQNVYLLADSRMYKMKKKHHDHTLGKLYNDLMNGSSQEGGNTNE